MDSKKPKKIKVSVIHGPNLNLLGKRQPEIYGTTTLPQINEALSQIATDQDIEISFFQSNHEGLIIDYIQDANETHGFLINPAAYTHTSLAIRDAFLAVNKPFIEVHLSDIKKRENFRQHSYFSDIALQVIAGKGPLGYHQGLKVLIDHLQKDTN